MSELSLLPQAVDILVPRGSTETIRLTFPEDITGDTVSIIVRDEWGGAQKFRVDQTSHEDPANGVTTIVLDNANTDDGQLSGSTTWRYTIVRTHGGEPTAWWAGKFVIKDTAILPVVP